MSGTFLLQDQHHFLSIEKKLPAEASKLVLANFAQQVLMGGNWKDSGGSWWAMQTNQSGECSLLCVFGLFVFCVASPSPSSLYCLSLNGKQRCLILEVALLLVTLHFSLFDTRGLARSRCWPARCQHWHGELATRVRVIALAPSSLLIHPASLSKAFSKGGSLMTDTAKAVLLRGLTKRHKERCEPFNVMYLFIVFSWSLECWWGNSVRHCPKLILVGTLVTYYLLQTKRGIVLWVSLKA